MPDGDVLLVLCARDAPSEPRQVLVQAFRAHATESADEPVEEGVERVDTVDGMVVRLRSGERDTQRLHGSGVGGGLVGDGDDTERELAIQCGEGAVLGQ